MPGRRTHTKVGALAGGGTALVVSSGPAWQEFSEEARSILLVGAVMGGAGGGRFPDYLEPAVHPHHRNVFHSVAVGAWVLKVSLGPGAITFINNQCRLYQQERDTLRSYGLSTSAPDLGLLLMGALLGVAAGYVSHLAADATTARGLPIVARNLF